MKRSLLCSLIAAFLIVGVSACAPRHAAQFAPSSEASKTDVAVQPDELTKPADAASINADAGAEGTVTPADALKLMLLQLLVAR